MRWYINKEQIRFVVYLRKNYTDISTTHKKLKEILCVDDSVLKIENNLIILQRYDETINLTEFT